jgi:alkylated DNA repair dioxygenase AlkB
VSVAPDLRALFEAGRAPGVSAPVRYWPESVDHDVTAARLVAGAPWEQRTSARLEAFWATVDRPYTYGQGRGARTYRPALLPEWMRRQKAWVDRLAGCDMQLCFLNRYDDQHQHLGWHADDSPEQDDSRPIVVQSFGAARELWFRPKGSGPDATEKLLLADGSTLMMLPGMQQTHVHRIPKHDRPCGVRVSLTWRALK